MQINFLAVDVNKYRYIQTPIGLLIFACGALAASISVGIVIPSTWFVYLYNTTVRITVVVMGTKQFNDKIIHRQQVKTGFVRKWENRSPGLFQDYSRTFFIFQGLDFFPILCNTTFKSGLFSDRFGEMKGALDFF